MQSDRTWPAVVLLVPTDETRRAPIGALNQALARTMVAEFGDDVLLMVVGEGRARPAWDKTGPVHQVVIEAPSDTTAANAAVLTALNRDARHYAYTFLDTSRRSAGYTNQLIPFLGAAEVEGVVERRLVRLRRSPPITGDTELLRMSAGWQVLSTVILQPPPDTSGKRSVLKEMVKRMGGQPAVETSTSPASEGHPIWDEGAQQPEEVRVRLSWQEGVTGSLSRWARAVSHRRVGLALGGSGAWGYSHAAMITSMEDANIPIDLITSASSGSVMGAYYAALGRDGIDTVLKRGWRLDAAVMMCMCTMSALELCVALDTGFVPLRQLEVMFFPVTSNLSNMKAERVLTSSLPWGVRASSTAPGVWGSTTTADAIYVDGAVTDNVPARLTEWLGAGLVVATNPLPAPLDFPLRSLHIGPFTLKWDRGMLFRCKELVSSLSVMFHDTGEWEARGYIQYDPPQAFFPLGRTFMFNQGPQVYDETLAQPAFHATMAQVRGAWEVLSAARTGL